MKAVNRRKETSRRAYEIRVNRVMDYVQTHLDQNLSIQELAAVAGFSEYHFHRIFSALAGETLGDFIRRLRLENGSFRIRYEPDTSITEIALGCGFGSGAAFSRAFRDYYGITPTQWGELPLHSKMDQVLGNLSEQMRKTGKESKSEKNYDHHTTNYRRYEMNPSFETTEERTIVYWRAIGPYGGGGEIGKVWQKARSWAAAHELLRANYELYGISLDDPAVTPASRCRYDACVPVKPGIDLSNLNSRILEGGRIAVFPFDGPAKDLGTVFDYIYKKWLPESGYMPGSAPCLERYRPEYSMDKAKGTFQCDICIPVVPA